MKTQIIHLARHDDIASTLDKLTWSVGGRILLVWPRHARVLARRLDLVLLQRHCLSQGSQFGIVTHDPIVLENACELGIPVFKNIERARKLSWGLKQPASLPVFRQIYRHDLHSTRPATTRTRTSLSHQIFRYFFFSMAVLAISLVVGIVLPSGEVRISQQILNQQDKLQVIISPDPAASQSSLASMLYHTKHITLAGEDTAPATGWMNIPGNLAEGEVVFINLTDNPVSVPAGTVILSLEKPVIRFQTSESVDLPGEHGSEGRVHVRALEGGSSANLPAGRVTAVEGRLGLFVSVSNPSIMSGGSDLNVRAPTQQDLEALEQKLIDKLGNNAVQQFQSYLADNERLIMESIRRGRVILKQSSPEVGNSGDTITLAIQIEFEAAVYQYQELEGIVEVVLNSHLPQGTVPIPGSLRLSTTSDSSGGAETAAWYSLQVAADRKITYPVDPNIGGSLAFGQKKVHAKQTLENVYPSAESINITTSPVWWPLMPFFPFRLEVVDLNLHPVGMKQEL